MITSACLECNINVQNIGQHVKFIHKMTFNDYVSKHDLPRVCHCENDLPVPKNTITSAKEVAEYLESNSSKISD